MLVERTIIYQISDGAPRLMDAERAAVWCGVPVLAAVFAGGRKGRAAAEKRVEKGSAAFYTQYYYAEPLGGGVLLH